MSGRRIRRHRGRRSAAIEQIAGAIPKAFRIPIALFDVARFLTNPVTDLKRRAPGRTLLHGRPRLGNETRVRRNQTIGQTQNVPHGDLVSRRRFQTIHVSVTVKRSVWFSFVDWDFAAFEYAQAPSRKHVNQLRGLIGVLRKRRQIPKPTQNVSTTNIELNLV